MLVTTELLGILVFSITIFCTAYIYLAIEWLRYVLGSLFYCLSF